MSKYLTISEIAELSDIPNSTCRRYLAAFEAFFLVKGGNRLKKYEVGAVDVLKRIKQLYEEGQDTNEIHSILVNEFPLVVDSEKQQEKEQTPTVPGLATSEDINEIKQALEQQKQFNEMLLKKLEEQNEYIKQSLERRDRDLMESIRELQETKRLTAATIQEQPPERKGFFARLFSK